MGKGVTEVGLDRRDVDNVTRIEATHDGYAKAYGFTHSRRLFLKSDGMELRGEDTLLPEGRPKDGSPVHVRFHLGPDIEITPTENVQTAFPNVEYLDGVFNIISTAAENVINYIP